MIESDSDRAIIKELVYQARSKPAYDLGQFGSVISAHQYRRLYSLVRKHIVLGGRVLDWGAGNGHFSFFLARAGYRATAFSIRNDHMSEWLPQDETVRIIGSSNEPVQLPFEDRSFDAVASIGVLEHVADIGGNLQGSLNEIRRILAPGGRFICYHLPNSKSWIEALARLLPNHHYHSQTFTPREMYSLFDSTGLEILEAKRYGFLPRNIWGQIPSLLSDSSLTVRTWDLLDDILSALFRGICQNYQIVARRVGDP